jgi:hypothetical protein
VKVFYGASNELTTQLYFEEKDIRKVESRSSYAARGSPDTLNDDEGVPETLVMNLAGDETKGYAAKYIIGIDTMEKRL